MILVADLTMSQDNVLAVGALSQGNLLALSIEILVSKTILLYSSALVAALMTRLPGSLI
jgi:predicted tellurium resistance membrane protein TerC